MLLADKVAHRYPERKHILDFAEKFLFLPDTVAVARTVKFPSPNTSHPARNLPFRLCWYEAIFAPGVRLGMLLGATREALTPSYIMFFDNSGNRIDVRGHDEAFGVPLSLTVLLNTKNLANTEPVDKSRHNAARAKRGRPPLYSFRLCSIRRDASESYPESTRTGRLLRRHKVRGHARELPSHMTWIRDHERGDASLGHVRKEYVA